MGKYNFSATVNLVQDQSSKLKAYATLVLELDSDTKIAMNGFRVIEGSKGLFVTPPQTKGAKPGDDGKDQWFNNIRFLEPKEEGKETWRGPVEDLAMKAVLAAYEEAAGNGDRHSAAAAQTAVPAASASARPKVPVSSPALDW